MVSDAGMVDGGSVGTSVTPDEPPEGPGGTPVPVGVGGKMPEVSLVVIAGGGVPEGVSLGVSVGVSVTTGGRPVDPPLGRGSDTTGPVPEGGGVLLGIGGRSVEMIVGSPDGGAVGPGRRSVMPPERVGSGNSGVGEMIPSDLLSDVGIGRPTVGVGESEIPKAVVIPTKMPVPVVGIGRGRGTSVEVSTTLGGTTLGGTPPVDPTDGVGSGVGRIGGRDRPRDNEG